jgi:hypothetical protein
MTILCRPKGRGNWRVWSITVDVPADLFTFRAGDYFPFGSRQFHILEVRP